MRLLMVGEVSEILRIPKLRVYWLIRQGAIPAVHIGRRVRVPEERLREWIANGGVTTEELKAGIRHNHPGSGDGSRSGSHQGAGRD